MKSQWVCNDCYKQECIGIGKELESYTIPNFLEEVCNICKNKTGIYCINKHNICRHCKFWRFIRNEDYKDWKGSHGECKKITDSSQDDEITWIDKMVTYIDIGERLMEDKAGNELILESSLITKPNFGCNLFEDKEIYKQ